MLGARGVALYRHVVLPAALPGFVAGMKQGWAFAWRSLMAGELIVVIAQRPSLGVRLQFAREFSDATGLLAAMLVVLAIGIAVDTRVLRPHRTRHPQPLGPSRPDVTPPDYAGTHALLGLGERRPDMAASAGVSRISPGERVEADPTPGMVREQAIATEGLWAGFVRTAPGTTSGWHHHGEHDTAIYTVQGRVRLEFGPGGSDTAEAGPGDFLHVPKGVIHRESTIGDEESHLIVVRSGHGPVTVNVEGPAPADPGPDAM